MKHALHESVQLSWYSYLLILDTNKTSGHVSFNLNLDLNLETSVKTPAGAWIKCRGRIYILLKLILNIKNAANVVLHTAIQTNVLVLFRSCCLIGKSLKRVEVPCLFYVSWLKTIHTLNYYYYSIYLKNVECLKNNDHNTGKTGLYWFSRLPNYTYRSCFYNHYHSKNE